MNAPLSTSCASTNVNTCSNTTIASSGTLVSANSTFGANVPAGNAYSITLFDNGASTGSSCNIAAGQSTCASPITGLALTSGHTVELRVVRTAGANGVRHDGDDDAQRERRDGGLESAHDDRVGPGGLHGRDAGDARRFGGLHGRY